MLSVLKAGVLALIAAIWALLGWTAALALAAVTFVAVPLLLMLGLVAIAFTIQLVATVLGGAG